MIRDARTASVLCAGILRVGVYQAPLTALDAASGQTLMTYAGTQRTDEITHQGGRLVLRIPLSVENAEVPAGKKGRGGQKDGAAVLVAVDAATGRRLWQTEPGVVVPLSLAIGGENVFFHDQNAAVCLDAASGKPRWRSETGGAGSAMTLVVHEKVVLCANHKQVVALTAADGKPLWTLPGAKGFGAAVFTLPPQRLYDEVDTPPLFPCRGVTRGIARTP